MPPPPPPKLKSTKSSEFWNALKRLTVYLCTPENSASLAAFRILFYALMVLDIPHERAFAYVDYAYGSKANPCQFPLFDSVPRPSALTASVIFIIMLTGAFGSLVGLCYKISTLMFAGAYWFIFIQDKTSWNNHSYLYGLIGSMFCFMDANARWSIDAHINKYKNKRVPKWNYFLLRAQIFLVYFLAGLKKTEIDWLTGYSCSEIVHHWVFSPFRLFLPNEYISWIVVHICGFLIDLFVGFLLVYKPTRLFATLVVSCFHGMNSMIFSIGMFPYVMLCTTTIF